MKVMVRTKATARLSAKPVEDASKQELAHDGSGELGSFPPPRLAELPAATAKELAWRLLFLYRDHGTYWFNVICGSDSQTVLCSLVFNEAENTLFRTAPPSLMAHNQPHVVVHKERILTKLTVLLVEQHIMSALDRTTCLRVVQLPTLFVDRQYWYTHAYHNPQSVWTNVPQLPT